MPCRNLLLPNPDWAATEAAKIEMLKLDVSNSLQRVFRYSVTTKLNKN